MPITMILKQLLPGFLPLFIFIAADEIWGTKIGLYVAVISGIIELAITRIKYKRYDGFIIADTVFLLLLGGVSILLENAIFFKLKPALLELILCILLAAASLYPEKFIKMMTSKYMKNAVMEINDKGVRAMRRMMLIMTLIFAFHTALIIYAAFFLSQGAWAFISGGLVYIIFAVIIAAQFIFMLIRKRMHSPQQVRTQE